MKVLIALDGSECSRAAVDFVLHRPWSVEDNFLVLHVVEPMPADMGINYVPTCTSVTDNAAFSTGQALADDAKARLEAGLPGHTVRSQVVTGLVKSEIIEIAKKWPADMIVMGSHGRKGMSRLFLGSIAEEVLKDAPCSVEIVKHDGHEHGVN